MIIYERFLSQTGRHPQKTAIVHRQQRLSYADVARGVERLMTWMNATGAVQGSRIGLFLHNGPLFTMVLLASAATGATIAPLPVSMGAAGLRNALQRLRLTHAIGEHQALRALSELEFSPPKECLLTAEDAFASMEHPSASPSLRGKADADAPWILTMTSGSTGDPKPIVLSQRCKLYRAIQGVQRVYDLSHRDVILTASPMYHSLGMRLALLPLLIGATSVILHKFAPKPWLRAVQTEKITFTIPISNQLRQLLPLVHGYHLDSLRCLVSSSATLSVEEKALCLERFKCRLHECYGTSEVGIVTDLPLSSTPRAADSVGKALPHVDLRIINDEGENCEPGEIGEIVCRTPTAFSGYDNQPQATAAAFIGGYFRTGDLGYLDDQGFLHLKGRKKEIIKVGGVSVFPQDIEQVIMEFPGVRACAAVGVPDQRLGEKIAVALVVEHRDGFDLPGLQRHCITQLADYQQPLCWYLVDSLPQTALGKLQRNRLAEQLRNIPGSGRPPVAPEAPSCVP